MRGRMHGSVLHVIPERCPIADNIMAPQHEFGDNACRSIFCSRAVPGSCENL
jgi:hypothetical protein